jgi:hypothetical protein
MVLCPTRGGDASIPNQMCAIQIALERQAGLVFLYVSDVHFLDHMRSPVPVDMVEAQLDEVGEFILAMAQERAANAGVEAQAAVRRGQFRVALEAAIDEFGISVVVLGSASQGTGVTTPEYRSDLIRHLMATRDVEVILSAAGTVVEHHHPISTEGSGADE